MNKTDFLNEIKNGLNGLSQADIDKALDFYKEAIDDRMDDGMSEEEAVKDLGDPKEIANDVLLTTPLPKLIKAKTKPNRSLRAWEIVLLILGFPLWFPLTLTAMILVFVVYVVLWSLIIAFVATLVALIISGIAVIILSITGLFTSGFIQTLAAVGAGLVAIGLGLLLIIPVKIACKGLIVAIKAFGRWVKRLFIK